MSAFSAEKALMSGFRVIGRNPMAVLAWAGVYFVLGLLPQGLLWSRLWPQMAAEMAHSPPDPQAVAAAMSGMWTFVPLFWLLGLVLISVLYGAVYRAVLEPEERANFYLRLSARELWLGLTILVLLVCFFVLCLVVAFAIALIGQSSPGIVTFVAVVAALVGCIWLAMRFSLAAPMAFAERRFVFMESWPLTSGHALKLFGVALALVVIILAIEMALAIPVMIIAAAMGMAGALTGRPPVIADPSQMLAHAAPWIVLGAVVVSLFAAVVYAVLGAPWANIYQQLTAPADEAAA